MSRYALCLYVCTVCRENTDNVCMYVYIMHCLHKTWTLVHTYIHTYVYSPLINLLPGSSLIFAMFTIDRACWAYLDTHMGREGRRERRGGERGGEREEGRERR